MFISVLEQDIGSHYNEKVLSFLRPISGSEEVRLLFSHIFGLGKKVVITASDFFQYLESGRHEEIRRPANGGGFEARDDGGCIQAHKCQYWCGQSIDKCEKLYQRYKLVTCTVSTVPIFSRG